MRVNESRIEIKEAGSLIWNQADVKTEKYTVYELRFVHAVQWYLHGNLHV